MKMTGDGFQPDKVKRDAIIKKIVEHGDSALSSKENVRLADEFAHETIKGLTDFWETRMKAWPKSFVDSADKQQFYQRELDAMETQARKCYDAACDVFDLPEKYRHEESFPIIPTVKPLYVPPPGITSKGTIMVVLSMGLLKGVGPDGKWDLELAKEVFTNKFLLASVDAFNATDDPDAPCDYTIVCTEAHEDVQRAGSLNSSKPSAFGGTCSGHRSAANDEQDRRMAEQGSPTVLDLSNSGVERALWGRPGDGSGQGSECSRRWPRCVERFEAVVESLALRRGVS